MSELKVYVKPIKTNMFGKMIVGQSYYLKSEADKVIAEKDAEISRLKNSIVPKQSDKTLQKRLNEVCEKHGVSTLQDLDWAFCESEKRHTKDNIEAAKIIARHKYKRCLAMADFCYTNVHCIMGHRLCAFNDRTKEWFERWYKRWLELAEKFK